MFVPKWVKQLPFYTAIEPVVQTFLVLGNVGIFMILAGLITGRFDLVIFGLLVIFVTGVFVFMLWRDAKDNGFI